MPSEEIGTCGYAQWPDRKLIAVELEFGIACLRPHCGPEPPGTSIELEWHDHEIGAYATISLVWEQGSLFDEHWEYIERCSKALASSSTSVSRARRQRSGTGASAPGDAPLSEHGRDPQTEVEERNN